jgi:hypothetical protein
MSLTQKELDELLGSEPKPPPPRPVHWPFPPPPRFYECDSGARYSTHEALCAYAARSHE